MPRRDDAQILVRYYEIALRGKNRHACTAQLAGNLRTALGSLAVGPPRLLSGRIGLPLRRLEHWPEAAARLSRLYGIANFSLALPCERSLPALCAAVERHWPQDRAFRSFRVSCRRADKSFALDSPQLERELGAFVHGRFGLPVDLEQPELRLWVEVLPERLYFSYGRQPGAGGLPQGSPSSGQVLALLSGGIDSPVAAARLMRRGALVRFVHFSGQPFHDRTSERKARELCRLLVRSQLSAELHHVPFGELQRRIVVGAPAALRVVLYRRLMLRIAEHLAHSHGALALVTGESLGQVASQTLQNLAVIDEAVALPVLRPLVGMDKQEIVEQARALGTFDTSILPDQDCCQLFTPPNPTTLARREQVQAVEDKLDVPALVQMGLAGARVESFRFPQEPAPAED